MKKRSRAGAAVLAGLCLSLGLGSSGSAQKPASGPVQKEAVMTMRASGTFEVKLSPQDDKTGDPTLGRMSLEP